MGKRTVHVLLRVCLVGMLLISYSFIKAQSIEVGVFSGATNYMGDIQKTNIESDAARLVYGAFARFNTSDNFAFKTNFYHGKISGADRYYLLTSDIERDLSFQTDIYEASIYGEIAIMNFGTARKIASTYIFGGISGFYFNPKTLYNGRWIELQPLGTEGQGLSIYPDKHKYERYSFALPFGLGFRVNFTKRICLGFEIGIRKAFTDYIDDVSTEYPDYNALAQSNPIAADLSYRAPSYLTNADVAFPSGLPRGNPDLKDYFVFGGINLSTYLFNKK